MTAAVDNSKPFETRDLGTDELLWHSFLEALEEWEPRYASLTVVAPHPDDETLGAGGLIHTYAQRGEPIRVVLVTDGELARPEVENLADRRAGEMRSALALLAPNAQWVRLGLPDGGVYAHRAKLEACIHRLVPARSLLVAPYEHDGHTDHEATAQACLMVARKLGVDCVRYPIWAWHRLKPADFKGYRLVRLALPPAAVAAKQRAMACYQSQLEERPGGAIVPVHVRTYFCRPYEVFVRES